MSFIINIQFYFFKDLFFLHTQLGEVNKNHKKIKSPRSMAQYPQTSCKKHKFV